MAKFNVHAGHNGHVPGANGYLCETKEAREVKNKVISLLQKQGHTVYDCTDETGKTVLQNLINIVNKCNSHIVDLDISIHFNAFNTRAYGVEVYEYDNSTTEISTKICEKITELGFKNRGVKDGSELYVLKNTISKAILIECCFCDNKDDSVIYDAYRMAKAIVEGILNINIKEDNLYRIRKTWSNAASQIGAYKNIDNAIEMCKEGYYVFNCEGEVVYKGNLYRIRKSWSDSKSQLGAYRELSNARNNCPSGYKIFDSDGKAVV